MRMKRLSIIVSGMLLLCGCTEDVLDRVTFSDTPITFSAEVGCDWNESAPTRSTTVSTGNGIYLHCVETAGFDSDKSQTRGVQLGAGADITRIGLSGYLYGTDYDNSTTTLENTTANFINNVALERNNQGAWIHSKRYFWPSDGSLLAFYAYYPYDATRVTVKNVAGPMQFDYEMPATNGVVDADNQVDLMSCAVTDLTHNNSANVALPLRHALTAVKFVLDNDNVVPGVIKSVSFENVYRKATYTVGNIVDGVDYGWNHANGIVADAITYTYGNGGFDTTDEDHNNLTPDEATFLMIPQAFTEDNQRIAVVINDGAQDYTLHFPLKSTTKQWLANTTITYKLSTNTLNVLTMGDVTYPVEWGTINFPFKSDYVSGDAIGLFAVDGAGKVINANVKFVFNGTSWSQDGDENLFFPSTYNFYAYYPYVISLTGLPAKGDNVLVGEEGHKTMPTYAEFFAGAREHWSLPLDQNNATYMGSKWDLQIGHASIINGTTISFNVMHHALGLVSISLAGHQIPKKRTFNVNVTSNYSNYTDSELKMTVLAHNQFAGNTPCLNDELYYFIVKGSAEFNSEDGSEDRWAESIIAAANDDSYAAYVAYSRRHNWSYGDAEWNFSYTGAPHVFTTDSEEAYKYMFELWGASGGGTNGGKGAYLKAYSDQAYPVSQTLYVYVGGQGSGTTGGWNGGANSTGAGYGGGGASDISAVGGEWNDADRLQSRIIIAAGGGGAGTGAGADAGGWIVGSYAGDHWEISWPSNSGGSGTRGAGSTGVGGGGGGYTGGAGGDTGGKAGVTWACSYNKQFHRILGNNTVPVALYVSDALLDASNPALFTAGANTGNGRVRITLQRTGNELVE